MSVIQLSQFIVSTTAHVGYIWVAVTGKGANQVPGVISKVHVGISHSHIDEHPSLLSISPKSQVSELHRLIMPSPQ